jgi:hypothetical protein
MSPRPDISAPVGSPPAPNWPPSCSASSSRPSSLIAAPGIWYATNTQVRDQLTITQEGQITDRYTKAVETLGDDVMDVRLGRRLRLAAHHGVLPRDHPTVANVLATYVRTHTSKPPKKGGEVPADVHAALAVLVQRDATRDKSFSPDL